MSTVPGDASLRDAGLEPLEPTGGPPGGPSPDRPAVPPSTSPEEDDDATGSGVDDAPFGGEDAPTLP